MAPPPKHVITRRLIKKYTRQMVPMISDNSGNFLDALKNCMLKTNFDMTRCMEYLEKFDEAKMKFKEHKDKVKLI